MANDINKEDPHYKGEYGSIYEVNRKFPTGGVAGDFVVIDGWAHYWNAARGTWCVNAERDSYWDELITNIIEKFKLVRGATYMGVASLDTVPTKVIGAKMYYFATVAGKYKNFDNLVVPQGINVLYSENGSSWVNTTLLEVAQELGVSTNKVVSQKALNDALAKKFDKENIAQEFGDSEDKVVSQFALPFREIESPEFIKVIVDANDHLLFTINLDGEVDWGKGIPAPIKAKFQDIINQCQQDKTDLLGILDKTTIKDEEGNVQDTPFRYIQNEEFIFAKVDAEDKLLFGIEWDGTPRFGKTSAVEDRLQEQVTHLAERVATIMGDEDTTNVIDTMNELKKFFAEIENTQSLTDILANLDNVAKNLDKTTIKDEEGNAQDTPFRVIENEEFFWAVVDSEYKVALGIRRDGLIICEIHAVNALKQVIPLLQSDLASLQEKVGTIDTNLKELFDVFSLQENPEYMAVEKDADGKVLAATYNDGSHYSHNLKSETIDAKVDKEEGKSLINKDVSDAHSTLEDPEGRTEITTDAEDKILGYRDSEGTRHEHKISASHINLSDDAAKEVNEAFKSAGIKMENPSDFSKNSYVELPLPRIAAQVRIYASKLPTTKQDDIEAEIEYNDKDGNYFRKPVILNSQGSSSMSYIDKKTGERGNIAIDINDGSKIKFGDFPAQDSFHLKKYYIDAFRGQCIVGYHLIEQMYMTRPYGERRPWDYLNTNNSVENGTGSISKDFDNCSKSHPDGFPIRIIWVNSSTKKETVMGVYAWNLKKSREVYNVDKKKAENIILDGKINSSSLFGGAVDWTKFEIRNPKSLLDINGNKYDGDNPKELSDTDSLSKKVKDYIIRLSGAMADLKANNNKETFENYFNVPFFIDYFLQSQVTYNADGFDKNWIWGTLDGQKWNPNIYDEDSIFGLNAATGAYIIKNSDKQTILGLSTVLPTYYLSQLYETEIKERYKELRDVGVFTVDNIVGLLESWLNSVGYDNLKEDLTIYNETHSYRSGDLNDGWEIVGWTNKEDTYNNEKTYNEGDTCIFYKFSFKATKTIIGIPPTSTIYEHGPIHIMGFYNSIGRVKRWLVNRINFLDSNYKYNV